MGQSSRGDTRPSDQAWYRSANTQLTKRPDQLPAWDSSSADQKRLYARMMEVYAGALSHADYQHRALARRSAGIRVSWRIPL